MKQQRNEQRIPVGAEVEWIFCGRGITWRRGRIVAFVPAGESAFALLPEEAQRTGFADRSNVDRYIVAVEEVARVRYGQPEVPTVLEKPLYCAPTAATVEAQYSTG